MKPKEPRINVRVDVALKSRIQAVTERTGIDESTLLRNCLEALCDHVERHGQISFPLLLNANGVVPMRYPKPSGAQALHEKPTPKKGKP